MATTHSDATPAAVSQPQSTLMSGNTSASVLDRKTLQALFGALRTSIPTDVQQALVRDSLEELKFLIARQPRLSSFHHRRRESLRHPALAMATKNYYQLCRRKRLELAVQSVAAEQQGQQQHYFFNRGDAQEGQADNAAALAAQRESELVDHLLAEYARSGGFQEEYGWSKRTANATNLGESGRFNASTSFGSRGLGGTSGMELRSEASSMSESRNGCSTFLTDAGNTSFVGTSGIWRSCQPGVPRGSTCTGNHVALADCAGLPLTQRHHQSFSGGNDNTNDGGSGGGYQRSSRSSHSNTGAAGRFFSRRFDRPDGRVGSARVGSARGDGGARWGAEMLGMVVRRAEEELKAGSGGDAYLLSSSRPIEILLTCYGGVQRDSAVMALGAASLLMGADNFAASTANATPADADPLFNAVVEEDVRWDQLAQCYRQLLREANAVRETAAAVVASDPLVNDVIRRFWQRLTVSPAAQHAHKAQEAASRKRDVADAAAFSKRPQSRIVTGGADEDDLDEIQTPNENKSEPLPSGGGSNVGGGRAGRARSATGRFTRVSKDKQEVTPKKGMKGKGKGKKKKPIAGFSTKSGESVSTVAYYMTPFQYVYLHTRLAHILLPESNALDMELLYFIQEDLLVDAAYSEKDPAQTLYFGEAPHLTGSNTTVRSREAERQLNSKERFAHWQDDDSAASDDDVQKGPPLRQRFLALRRHGYALGEDAGAHGRIGDDVSVIVRYTTSTNIPGTISAAGSSFHMAGTIASNNGGAGGGENNNTGKQTVMNALLLTNKCFSTSELPSLTFQQFWCSMMELADNWTCCAGHPVETAIFLWELYAEVFGHNWGAEDAALATALEEKAATVTKSERERIDEEVTDALNSFNELVKTLRERERGSRRPSSTGGLSMLLSGDLSFTPSGAAKKRRRRRGPRKGSTPLSRVGSDMTTVSDLSASFDSDFLAADWDAMANGDHLAFSEWTYTERVGKDGVKRRYRRRVVHRHLQRRGGTDDKNASSRSSFRDDEALSFILEEELDEHGAVIKQRKRRYKNAVTAATPQKKRRHRTKGHGRRSPKTTTPSLYERRRKFDEDNAKQLRRLESRRRVETGSSRGSSLTSWSSIDDGTTEDRRNGHRRRGRIRRSGPRRDRLKDFSDNDETSSMFSASAEEVGDMKGGKGKSTLRSRPTSAELAELLENKDWLCSVLGAKGICLPPQMFDVPAEQVLLYELLKLTKESEARGGDVLSVIGPNVESLFNLGDGEGSGGIDLSRLAALLAQSATFNLNGLDDSVLMQRLLGEGSGASQFLTPLQLQQVLLALTKEQGSKAGAAVETEGMRKRRLYLLQMLKERQEQEERERLALLNKEASEGLPSPAKASEGAAEDALSPAGPSTALPSATFPRPISGGLPPFAARDDGGYAAFVSGLSGYPQRIPFPPSAKSKSSGRQNSVDDSEWVLSPTTVAERREQERLFRELEAYWTDRFSQRGRYRVHITEYTKEQLDEFFAHLHLGPRQRALVRGRAPLAAPTSLVGGTLHQDTPHVGTLLEANVSRRAEAATSNANASATPVPSTNVSAPPLAVAPVKLFTLTTEASLSGALHESYQSYLSDKVFSKSCKNAVFRMEQRSSAATTSAAMLAAVRQERSLAPSNLPPLAQSARLQGKNSTSLEPHPTTVDPSVAAATAAAVVVPVAASSAIPPSPQLPLKRLPSLTGASATRRNQTSSSANSSSSLPKV